MTRKEVFSSLKAIFPQVDIRILKAVAIEHHRDPGAAVEFILSEVLPSITVPLEFPEEVNNPNEVMHTGIDVEQSEWDSSKQGDEEVGANCDNEMGVNFFPSQAKIACQVTPNPDSQEEPVVELNEAGSLSSHQKAILQELHESFQSKSIPVADGASNYRTCDITFGTFHVKAPYVDEVLSSGCSSSVIFENAKSSDVVEIPENEEKCNNQGGSFSCSENELRGMSSALNTETPDAVENGSAEDKDVVFGLQREESELCLVNNESNLCSFSNGTLNEADKDYPATIATRSGHSVSTDVIEDLLKDAKSNKMVLESAMESVTALVKVVECHERQALQAKDEASMAGLDILAKVEDLKRMLVHAKETNFMHAGEVYGEKSILATEARELQSRLLSLANERDKSLFIIEEMRQTLDTRLALAESQRLAAEDEKLKKEERALRVFNEQQAIMDMVVEESKKLKEAAEENAKLREFLMDRGRMVDMLQGEMAVICEDVLLLKEKIDGRVAFADIPQSSQFSFTSCSTSTQNQETSSVKILEPEESAGRVKVPSPEVSESQKLEVSITNSNEMSVAAIDEQKISSDDDWDLFDDASEVHA